MSDIFACVCVCCSKYVLRPCGVWFCYSFVEKKYGKFLCYPVVCHFSWVIAGCWLHWIYYWRYEAFHMYTKEFMSHKHTEIRVDLLSGGIFLKFQITWVFNIDSKCQRISYSCFFSYSLMQFTFINLSNALSNMKNKNGFFFVQWKYASPHTRSDSILWKQMERCRKQQWQQRLFIIDANKIPRTSQQETRTHTHDTFLFSNRINAYLMAMFVLKHTHQILFAWSPGHVLLLLIHATPGRMEISMRCN